MVGKVVEFIAIFVELIKWLDETRAEPSLYNITFFKIESVPVPPQDIGKVPKAGEVPAPVELKYAPLRFLTYPIPVPSAFWIKVE